MSFVRAILRRFARGPDRDEAVAAAQGPVFDQPFYSDITRARLDHLRSLDLPLAGKTVVDLGAGIGRFCELFLSYGCEMLCIDGRESNIVQLRSEYPQIKSMVINLEDKEIVQLGPFDVVFCYGLLYHLSDPLRFLRGVRPICREMLLLETCVMDARSPVLRLVSESEADASQSIIGIGSRPSPAYVRLCLRIAGFAHVYEPRVLPGHREFHFKEEDDMTYMKDGHLIRRVFVATHQPLHLPGLREME